MAELDYQVVSINLVDAYGKDSPSAVACCNLLIGSLLVLLQHWSGEVEVLQVGLFEKERKNEKRKGERKGERKKKKERKSNR